MDGAVGHLYDNRDLTFCEIFNILSSAASGKLEEVSEKLDGLNLVFSWDVSTNSLRVARNSGNIKNGGLDASSLVTKFARHGNLSEAFNSAFKVLGGALDSLSLKTKLEVFGHNANRWYSMEVIYASSPNIVNYDSNNVIFHGWPIFKVSENMTVEMIDDDVGGIKTLTENIEKMQNAVEIHGWKIHGPVIARMKKLSDGSALRAALFKINEALSEAGLDDSATIRDYISVRLDYDAEALGLSKKTKVMVVERCLAELGSPTLVDIKKCCDKSTHGTISDFVKSSGVRLKDYIKPIESAINELVIDLLKGLKPILVTDVERETVRLQNEVSKVISTIELSSGDRTMTMLNEQMEKLKSVGNITTPTEGVVFIYKGNAYKFTGNFFAINQVLGLFRQRS